MPVYTTNVMLLFLNLPRVCNAGLGATERTEENSELSRYILPGAPSQPPTEAVVPCSVYCNPCPPCLFTKVGYLTAGELPNAMMSQVDTGSVELDNVGLGNCGSDEAVNKFLSARRER